MDVGVELAMGWLVVVVSSGLELWSLVTMMAMMNF